MMASRRMIYPLMTNIKKHTCLIYILIRLRLCMPLSWINQFEDLLISG